MKEMNLIKKSETTKDSELYGNLFYALQKYETLSEQDLALSSSFDRQAVIALTNEQMKNELMHKIIGEWYGKDCYITPGEKIPCQICHTPNKKIHYIKNRYNRNELNVGSDCIKQFPEIENFKEMQRNINEREKIRKQELRRAEFAQLEVDDPEFVSKARKKFNNINIVLPFKLYNEIEQNLYDLNIIKTTYIKQGGDYNEIANQYNILKIEYVTLWNQAIEHYQRYHKNKLACKKYIGDWLKENHYKIWESISINNGLFTVDTLKFAYDSRYVKEHLINFSKHLKDDEIRIIDINGNSIRFAIQNEKYRNPVYFLISNKIFMEQIGCHCLTQYDYTYTKDKLNEIRIENYSQNVDALYNRMKESMNKAGIDIDVGKYSMRLYYKRLARKLRESKWSNKADICEIGYKKIADGGYIAVCNKLLFADNDTIEKEFKSILYRLEMTDNWLTQEAKDSEEEITKKLAMQKQKEFINYV